tara:strand:- start:1578 stop:1949 length:372 start_codon:yes stop_codon:yes gene_type:complete
MIKNYFLISLLFILIDAIYLSLASNYFNKQIKLIQGSKIKLNPLSTFLCYIFLTFGISYFIIYQKITPYQSFFLGLYVYGVYETTNHAILKDWKWSTVFMDTIWGAILFSLVTYFYYKIIKLI